MNIQELLIAWGGGILGSLLGLLGAAFGTWCGIRRTHGPKERAFMVKVAVWTWLLLAAMLGLVFGLGLVLPQPYKPWTSLVLLLLVPGMLIGIPACNRRQAQIRAEEAQAKSQSNGERAEQP
jgi:F0F1-type ATP synthase assembly protein I